MKLVTHVRDNKQHTELWLSLWAGGLKITPREKEVLAELILAYLYHKSKGLIEPYLSKEVFGTEVRKGVQEALEISSFNLTNVLASLKSKGCITDSSLNPNLIPDTELIFEFK